MLPFRSNKPKTIPPFLLIGLPKSGKTTISRIIAQELGVGVVNFDQEIKRTISPNHPAVIAFKNRNPNITWSNDLFERREENGKAVSVAKRMMRKFPNNGETLWRDLEGEFASHILRKIVTRYPDLNKRPILDIGGKIFLNTQFRKTATELGYQAIYLNADSQTVERHLKKNFNRNALPSNYELAAENAKRHNKEPFTGVIGLAHQHRRERTADYKKHASKSIDISGMSPQHAAHAVINRLRNPFKEKIRGERDAAQKNNITTTLSVS